MAQAVGTAIAIVAHLQTAFGNASMTPSHIWT